MGMSDPANPTVEIYLDPACPWAWLTSRWLRQVAQRQPISVVYRLFSLAEVNRGDDPKTDAHRAGERALLALVAARRAGGQAAMERAYDALADAWHERAQPLAETATLEAAMAAAGVADVLAGDALDAPDLAEELDRDHRAARERHVFGVPTLSIDGGTAWFGPIVDRRLDDDEAEALWEATRSLMRLPHVFEMKRERSGDADVGRKRMPKG